VAEITKVYSQTVPAMRFIGKKYTDNDRIDGNFSAKWDEWFKNDWFAVIEKCINTRLDEVYQDGDAYIGLMRWKKGEPFEYWIGIFTPENTQVPEGFEHVDFPKSKLGVCWVYGKDGDVYCKEDKCAEKLGEEGYKIIPDEKGAYWFFERYCCPRFTTPDEQGNIVLDICHYIE